MGIEFKIPRQTDQEVVAALGRIRRQVKSLFPGSTFSVQATPQHGNSPYISKAENPEQAESFEFLFSLNAATVDTIFLQRDNQIAIQVGRAWSSPLDNVKVVDDWLPPNHTPGDDLRSRAHLTIVAAARKELKAPDTEVSFTGSGDSDFTRVRNAQTDILSSLQGALQNILVESVRRNADLDRTRDDRYRDMEKELRRELSEESAKLKAEVDRTEDALRKRETALEERIANFNTKEASYVSREQQREQMHDLKEWLKSWKLTDGTSEKRGGVRAAYITALILSGAITGFSLWHGYELIPDASSLGSAEWWKLFSVLLKTTLPLALLATVLVAFIRWSDSWAKVHADHELAMRARLIDIGRSSWIIEAVRDAHQKGKDLPSELVRELSKNLFVNNGSNEANAGQGAANELLLDGLKSLRVKTPAGLEVDAVRGGKGA